MSFVPTKHSPSRPAVSPWNAAATIAAIALATLLGALAFEYIGGIRPCPLCLEQRIPWSIVIMLSGGAMLATHPSAPPIARPVAFAAIAAMLIWGIYIAGFHAGVEWKWWPGPPDCSASTLHLGDDPFSNLDPGQIVRCDEIAWSLFGLSLAGYNFLISLATLGVALAGLAVSWPRSTEAK